MVVGGSRVLNAHEWIFGTSPTMHNMLPGGTFDLRRCTYKIEMQISSQVSGWVVHKKSERFVFKAEEMGTIIQPRKFIIACTFVSVTLLRNG